MIFQKKRDPFLICVIFFLTLSFGCLRTIRKLENGEAKSELSIVGKEVKGTSKKFSVGFARGSGTKIFCSGTLIDSKFILTAAHCFDRDAYWQGNEIVNHDKYRVFYMDTWYDNAEVVLNQNFIRNDEFKQKGIMYSSDIKYDLAMVRVNTPLKGSVPICDRQLDVGSRLLLVGFGNDNYANTKGLGVKRFGFNYIEEYQYNHSIFVTITKKRNERKKYFNDTVIGAGDSGGSAVYRGNGEKCLAGVISSLRRINDSSTQSFFVHLASRESQEFMDYACRQFQECDFKFLDSEPQ